MISMLLQIGQRGKSDELVDLLAECHTRIRRFLEMARNLAANPSAAAEEARTVGHQICRYFSSAFLHHVADEDDLIEPRLKGSSASLDACLARMHQDHVQHADSIALLVGLCAEIEREPARLAELAADLAGAEAVLTRVLSPHLELEERELFPAIRALPADVQAAIRGAMRQRREADFAK